MITILLLRFNDIRCYLFTSVAFRNGRLFNDAFLKPVSPFLTYYVNVCVAI